jgi:hypothetical protein
MSRFKLVPVPAVSRHVQSGLQPLSILQSSSLAQVTDGLLVIAPSSLGSMSSTLLID